MKRIISLSIFVLGAYLMSSAQLNVANPKQKDQAEEKATPAPLLPLETFFKNPEKTQFKISPDGQSIAFLSPYENRMNVYAQFAGSKEAILLTRFRDRDITSFVWKGPKRILVFKDTNGDENYGIYSTSVSGGKVVDIAVMPNVRYELVDLLVNDPDHIIVSSNERDPQFFDLYKLNVNSGKKEMIEKNESNISSWLLNKEGKANVAVSTDGVNTSLLYREKDHGEWKKIKTISFKETLSPLAYTSDQKTIYCVSNVGRDKTAIVKMDPSTGKELEVIYEDKDVDVDFAKVNIYTNELEYVSYIYEYPVIVPQSERFREMEAVVHEQLKGYFFTPVSQSKDGIRHVIRTYSDKGMGAYYLYHAKERSLEKLSDVSPWINEKEMCEMQPITYISRDGLTIHGYLTLPKGVDPYKLPLIVNPHGGPWARDEWGFNPEVQFLANRGYAVLQMNFRGSTGYGREFWEKGFKEWGKKMQDDITDGIGYLVSERIVDADRVAIYGASYGGYATLAGMAFTPELYRCGIDYVGVSNLFTFMQTIPPYWKPYLDMMYEMVGNPEKDKAQFQATSPVFHTDKIKAPLFIAQGALDPRVNKDESDQMVEALRDLRIPVQYMLKENEGHGFSNEENVFDFYKNMEVFLAKYMKP